MLREKRFKLTEKIDSIKTLTVVFSDASYIPILYNWLEYSQPFLKNNLLVVSLDKITDDAISQRNIHTHLLEWKGDLASLWSERVKLIKQLINLGYNVIHSDADAVWLDDAVSYCEGLNSDIAFSQGTVWPPDAHNSLGVVLCCGFFYLRPTLQTIDFLEAWEEAVIIDGDDQRALNNLLLKNGISWNEKEDYTLRFKDKTFRCFNDVQITTLTNGMRTALLPHALFQRLPEFKNAIVKHPLSDKNGASTKEVLIKNKCWSIK